MAHRLIIGCNLEQYDAVGGNFDANRYLILDNIDDRQVQANAQIASQPMQSGDTISDHMYRLPVTYTVNGTFSLNGMNWNDISYDFMKEGDRLTNIQHVFERIKDEGILCTLITIDTDALPSYSSTGNNQVDNNKVVNASIRFKKRERMALQSITWVEGQNTLKFTFQFYQIIMVQAQEYVNLAEAERLELGLPCVSNPVGSSLGTVLADNGALAQTVTKAIYDSGYIENDFLHYSVEILQGMKDVIIARAVILVASAVLVGTVWAVSVIGVGAALTSSIAAIFPVGTVIVAAVAIVAAVGYAIWSIFNRHKNEEKKRKAFKLVNGSAEQDTNRLLNFLDDIEVEVNKVNSNVTIYSIQEDKAHQVLLNIAGNYYVINFEQNNTNDYGWYANITDMAGEPISGYRGKWCPVAAFTDMDRNANLWFKDDTKQYEVYLMNPALSDEYNATAAEKEAVKKKLTSYSIWVSKGNIADNIQKVYDAINKSIQNQGYN